MEKFNKLLKWDPCWGFDNKIYYLGAKGKSNLPFWLQKCHLFCNDKKIYSIKGNGRLCAGSFTKENYFGSISYDAFNPDQSTKIPDTDQAIFVCDKEWNLITEFRPSKRLTSKNKFFTSKKIKDRFYIAFRDPAPMNNGKFAVVTGGFRWGVKGNICEVSFTDNEFKITKETILEDNLRNFEEVERCTFWNEFIFFSVQNLNPIIKVGKLNKNGMYSYYGEVKNSRMLYGPSLNSKLQMLFWYKGVFKINNPKIQNLFYENGEWILKGNDINNFIKFQSKLTVFRRRKKRNIISLYNKFMSN